MITLLFRMKIREGKEEEALEQLQTMCTAVEKHEPRTIAYVYHRLQDDPMTVVLYESYVDEAALQTHVKTPHMAESQASLPELFDTSEIHAERIERIAGFARG